MMTKIAPLLTAFALATGPSACVTHSTRPTLPAETRTAVLSRYASGESLDQIAVDFRLGDRDTARDVVHDAMISLNKRYYRDR